MIKESLIAVVTTLGLITAAQAQLVPGSFAVPLDQSKDQSALVISDATPSEIPASPPYGDQGYTVNAWGNCNCIGNPALDNNDVVRVVGYNRGTGAAQVNGVSIYMVGGALDAPNIGATTALHMISVATNSGSNWGLDGELADSPFLQGYTGPARYLDNELDMNIGGAQTKLTYLSLGGMILAQPAYSAGVVLNYIGAGKLPEFIRSYDGMADVGLRLGRFSKQLKPNDGSQSIAMGWTDSQSNYNELSLTAFSNTMVLQTTDGASPPTFGVPGAAGIYASIKVSATCTLKISGGLVTDRQGC